MLIIIAKGLSINDGYNKWKNLNTCRGISKSVKEYIILTLK